MGGDENVLKLDCGDGCTILNILKTIELYTSKVQKYIVWNANYISIKLLKKIKNPDKGEMVVLSGRLVQSHAYHVVLCTSAQDGPQMWL